MDLQQQMDMKVRALNQAQPHLGPQEQTLVANNEDSNLINKPADNEVIDLLYPPGAQT